MPFTLRRSILWHQRMEARVVGGVILLVMLSLAGVMVAGTRVAERSALDRAAANLQDARSAFYRVVNTQAEFAAAQTRLIIALPVFRAVMINPVLAGDLNTLSQTTDGYRQELGAQFSVLTDPKGKPTATPGWLGGPFPAGLDKTIRGAIGGKSSRDIVPISGKLFLITSEPAKFDAEVLGSITFGFALDDRVAREVADITHSEVNLESSGQLVGSSLLDAERREVSTLLTYDALINSPGVSPALSRLGKRRFIEGTFPLFPDRPSDEVGHLVLLQDWAPTQRFLDELRNSLLTAGLVAFVLALGGGIVFSRRTSQPLMDIAVAAGKIAGGDWSRQVPVRGSAEATTMATAFNDMTRSLRDQASRLEASADRFSTVTQSARDAIVSADQDGNITFWNRSAEHIFGYTEAEVLSRPLTMLIAQSDHAGYRAALPEPAEDSLVFGHTIQVTAIGKDEGRFPAEFSLAVLRGPQGLILTAVIRDVTERTQVQEALRQRDEQLRQSQKMEAIGRLAGGVAHDFNNLLMAIRGYSELLVQGFDDGDDRKADAEEIVKAADRAAGLTRQLLAFSKRQVIAQQAVPLDQLVESTQNMLERLIGEDIQMTTEVWPGLAPVLADRTQLEQILVNLTVNARDAMPRGGRITVELRNIEFDNVGIAAHPGLNPGAFVEMAFSDTGSGMDADTASRIFEPFFTTKEGGKGTGLGLATVYGIVQQSGGVVEVQSKVGHGTTFFVYLPQARECGIPAPAKTIAAGSGAETVLLVEDDDRVRALVANMLKKNGYTVLLASQGDQALELAARYHGTIHLLLTDVVMPGISGRVLSERLTAARPETRVLYMSGYSDDAILRHGVKSAGTHFIQKPFAIDLLTQKIRDAISAPSNVPVSG